MRRQVAEEVAGSAAAKFVTSWAGDPVADALPPRITGALHTLALLDRALNLASCHPLHAAATPGHPRSVVRATGIGLGALKIQ